MKHVFTGNIGDYPTEPGGTTRKITDELVRQALTQYYPALITKDID
jgi:hypothetical protein